MPSLTKRPPTADIRPMGADESHPGVSLERLKAEERAISARRRRLHDRIDFLRAGGGGFSRETQQMLADLEAEEREVSRRRRELHQQIDTYPVRLTRAALEPADDSAPVETGPPVLGADRPAGTLEPRPEPTPEPPPQPESRQAGERRGPAELRTLRERRDGVPRFGNRAAADPLASEDEPKRDQESRHPA